MTRSPTLRAMARERDPLYAEVAHQVVDMDVLTPAQAARQVVAGVRVLTGPAGGRALGSQALRG